MQTIANLSDPMRREARELFSQVLCELAPLDRPEMNATVVAELEIQDGRPVFRRVSRTLKTRLPAAA